MGEDIEGKSTIEEVEEIEEATIILVREGVIGTEENNNNQKKKIKSNKTQNDFLHTFYTEISKSIVYLFEFWGEEAVKLQ